MLPNAEPIWHVLLYTLVYWQTGRAERAHSSSSFRIMFRIVLLILGQNHDMIYGFGRSFLSASSIRCVQMDSFSVYFIQRLSKYFHICKRYNARTFFFQFNAFYCICICCYYTAGAAAAAAAAIFSCVISLFVFTSSGLVSFCRNDTTCQVWFIVDLFEFACFVLILVACMNVRVAMVVYALFTCDNERYILTRLHTVSQRKMKSPIPKWKKKICCETTVQPYFFGNSNFWCKNSSGHWRNAHVHTDNPRNHKNTRKPIKTNISYHLYI